ncbi:hypothetical protein C3489_30845 [Streptomyces sp. Ru71]|uniref:hypothetical protein n=1 Tax=Streptomyces sp. Ru71 TaxID=2080746 RepID=UPI000CDD48BC|nr:hypothetical protein [Streptomyces sp. Ru71]POX46903.1 hypothetical protein C3489_30845 [Streptomyces sp. Ru71]
MRRATPLPLAAAALGLVLAACGHGPQDGPGDPRPLATGDPRHQPLDAYDTTEAEAHEINRARWKLAQACMTRLGFTGLGDLDKDPLPAWPVRPSGYGAALLVLVAFDDHRYGVTDPVEAARHGYHGPQAAYERRTSKRTWTLTEHLALTGELLTGDPRTAHGHRIPDHGCLGQASHTVEGAYPGQRVDLVRNLKTRSLNEGRRDPAWKKADQAWSACMKAAGHHYATPMDAQSDPGREQQDLGDRLPGGPLHDAPRGEPSAREKRTATADARCKQRTGYLRAVHTVDVRVQERLIAENKRQLEEERERQKDTVRTARDILRAHR